MKTHFFCKLKYVNICKLGRKLTRRDEEEDQYTDICMLTEILTNLLSKDFLDFHEQSVGDTVDVVDVVLHGLNVVVPLMNAELLKVGMFPLVFYASNYSMVSKIGHII